MRATFAGLLSGTEEYGTLHRPNDEGAPIYDLLMHGMAPKDFYETPASWYTGYPEWVGAVSSVIHRVRGQPNARVKIYRASPTKEFNTGDWVTLTPEYARLHAKSADSTFVCSTVVFAKDVLWAGDDLMEWGYFGPPKVAINCRRRRRRKS